MNFAQPLTQLTFFVGNADTLTNNIWKNLYVGFTQISRYFVYFWDTTVGNTLLSLNWQYYISGNRWPNVMG